MHQLEIAYENYLSAVEYSKSIKNNARKIFAIHLKETRIGLGLSVREFGEKIGVTGSLISQIELSSKSILSKEQIDKVVQLCVNAKL
jgi:hypothetical protein